MSQLYSPPPSLTGSWWERKKAAEEVRSRIEYDRLCRRYDRESVDELIAAITDVLCSTRPTLRIGGELLPTQQVQERFRQLEYDHLEYVIESLRRSTAQVFNVRAYLLTILYNAPVTISHFYQAEVQHDMDTG